MRNVVSAPNLELILGLSPFILVFDEFSYYTYHNARYDQGFRFLSKMLWNFNNNKWVPPSLLEAYTSLSGIFESIQVEDWANVTPSRFVARNESVYFLNNAQDLLFVSAPMTIIGFLLAWFTRRKVTCWKIPSLLAPFSTFSYLLASLIGDNIQYLSFRTFQQLRFIVPKSIVEAVSITMALVTLLAVVLCSCSLYVLIWAFDRRRFEP